MVGAAGSAMQVGFDAGFRESKRGEFELLSGARCLNPVHLAGLGDIRGHVHGRVRVIGTVGVGITIRLLDLPHIRWKSRQWLLIVLPETGMLYHDDVVGWLNDKTLGLSHTHVKLGSDHILDIRHDVGTDTIRARVGSRRKFPCAKRIPQETPLLVRIEQGRQLLSDEVVFVVVGEHWEQRVRSPFRQRNLGGRCTV